MAEKMSLGKRGQITMFIIAAIAIVVIIALVVLLKGGVQVLAGPEINPNLYISNCMKTATTDALDKMLPQGGFVNTENNSKMYNNTKVAYICYTKGNYLPCVNQHPDYLADLKNELVSYVQPKTEQCFDSLKTELEREGYSVSFDSPLAVTADIMPEKVTMKAERQMTTTKQGQAKRYDEFEIEIITPLYDLANVAIEIASQEASYCYFEYLGYMLGYPQFFIKYDKMSDSTKIYQITDKPSGKTLNIAIRGCAIPPGF